MSLSHLDLKPRMVKPRPSLHWNEEGRVMVRRINVKIPDTLLQRVNAATRAKSQLQARWLRDAITEKLEREGMA